MVEVTLQLKSHCNSSRIATYVAVVDLQGNLLLVFRREFKEQKGFLNRHSIEHLASKYQVEAIDVYGDKCATDEEAEVKVTGDKCLSVDLGT